jgi:hypothetical protein
MKNQMLVIAMLVGMSAPLAAGYTDASGKYHHHPNVHGHRTHTHESRTTKSTEKEPRRMKKSKTETMTKKENGRVTRQVKKSTSN